VLDISFASHPNLYLDYRECVAFLKDFKRGLVQKRQGKERTCFHLYSEFRTPKELLSLESYFATQDLEATRLIVWSDYDISNQANVARFKHYVDFRIWNARKEAVGSPIEGCSPMLDAVDDKHYLQSDLLRLLALHNYGGVFYDMDVVLLRDFSPVLGQEFMYMWGAETDFEKEGACASVLSLESRSPLSIQALLEAKKSPIIPNSLCWGKQMFSRLYSRMPFRVLPSAFFNIEWCINAVSPGLGDHIQNQWFDEPLKVLDHLYLDCFSWHWHNSSFKHKEIITGSKFDLLSRYISQKLVERGL